jgi:Ca-activated chloride channel family protein
MQTAVTEFIQHLLPDDRACLGTFSHVVSLHPELTADHDALIHHLGDDVPFPAGTALWDALEAGRAAVAKEGGRRVVLVLTDAADNSSVGDIDAVRSRVERDGVMVYGVGVRGREGLQTREMNAITRASGGWYFELKPTDDMTAAVQQIADELHRQYVLGFTPRTLDDRVHRIDVKGAKPGLTIRARRSYFASTKADVR